MREPGRAAHRQHDIADLEGRAVAEFRHRQRLFRLAEILAINLEHREIRERIGADKCGAELLTVREAHGDAGRATGDVVIGEDVSLG